jgi:hypothetical protein
MLFQIEREMSASPESVLEESLAMSPVKAIIKLGRVAHSVKVIITVEWIWDRRQIDSIIVIMLRKGNAVVAISRFAVAKRF